MAYTMPLSEAETRLQHLVEQIQATHNPVLLTTAGSSKPVAVVLEIDAYEQVQRQQERFYHMQLTHLKQWLSIIEHEWDNYAKRQEFVTAMQEGFVSLWELAPSAIQEFCAALVLSTKHLDAATLSKEHVETLRHTLDILRNSSLTDSEREDVHQRLIDCGIPPLMSYDDDSLAQAYLEEL